MSAKVLQMVALVVLGTALGGAPRAVELAPNVALLAKLADSGDADAQYGLGSYYLQHGESENDVRRAYEWLLRAARQQHVHAMFRVGVMLRQFDSIRDDGQALKWVRHARSWAWPTRKRRSVCFSLRA